VVIDPRTNQIKDFCDALSPRPGVGDLLVRLLS
jgi:hypothetical protein